MRKTTLSRSLLLTAALALGGSTAAQAQQLPTYDSDAPVVTSEDLTDGYYVLNIHNNSGTTSPTATGLVYYHQEGNDNQRRYRAIYDFSFENGQITDDRYVWILDWNDEHTAFTLQNAAMPNIYFSLSTNQNNQGRGDMTSGGTTALYEPVAVPDTEGRFYLKVTNPAEGSATPLFVFTNNDGKGFKNISYWNADPQPNANSGGVQMEFFKVSGYTSITYNYLYNGQVVGSETLHAYVGSEFPSPTTLPAFVTGKIPEGTVTAGTTEYSVDCTWDGPFAISESVQNATWYAVGLHTAPYYLHNTDGAESMTLAAEQQTIDASTIEAFDAQMWCFVGNPFDGFKIYNKAAGAGKILSSSTTMSGNNGGSTYPILMDEASLPEGNNTTWDVTPSTNISGVNGFYIAQHGLAGNRMNLRDGRLAYWSTNADHGSTFRVLNLQALYNAELGTYVSVSQSHQGYVGALKSEIIEQYQSTIDALTAGTSSPEAYVTLYNAFNKPENTIALTDGGYYRLHCAPVRGNFVLAVDAENMGLKSAAPSTSDASQIWKAVRTDDGKYKLMAQGYAIGGDNSLSLVDEAEAATFYFGKNLTTDSNGDPNLIWFFDTTHAESNNDKASGSTALNVDQSLNITLLPNRYGASAWLVEEVTTLDVTMNTVDNETWATLYLPFSVTTPEGVTAYTGTQKDENTIELTAVANGVIPAGTGVVLKGTTDSYTLTLTNDEAAPVKNNVISGTCLPISVTPETLENYYVLSTLQGVIGLYWPMTGTTELAANKAFIKKPEAAGAAGYRFVFGDNTTVGIDGVTLGQPDNTPYYDLSGRRIAQPAKGIYIHNGKKVFIK